jgi:hypothetical protein
MVVAISIMCNDWPNFRFQQCMFHWNGQKTTFRELILIQLVYQLFLLFHVQYYKSNHRTPNWDRYSYFYLNLNGTDVSHMQLIYTFDPIYIMMKHIISFKWFRSTNQFVAYTSATEIPSVQFRYIWFEFGCVREPISATKGTWKRIVCSQGKYLVPASLHRSRRRWYTNNN